MKNNSHLLTLLFYLPMQDWGAFLKEIKNYSQNISNYSLAFSFSKPQTIIFSILNNNRKDLNQLAENIEENFRPLMKKLFSSRVIQINGAKLPFPEYVFSFQYSFVEKEEKTLLWEKSFADIILQELEQEIIDSDLIVTIALYSNIFLLKSYLDFLRAINPDILKEFYKECETIHGKTFKKSSNIFQEIENICINIISSDRILMDDLNRFNEWSQKCSNSHLENTKVDNSLALNQNLKKEYEMKAKYINSRLGINDNFGDKLSYTGMSLFLNNYYLKFYH